jgi:phenylacetate-CoA ligase
MATPLIRYDVGDTVVVSKDQSCRCGSNGLLLDEISGRKEDYILTRDRRLVGRLDHLFKNARNVRLAQICQKDLGSITIRIVPELGFSNHDEDEIREEARLRLGSSMEVKFEMVSHIPRTKSGKFPFVISEISDKQVFGECVSDLRSS